MLLLSFEKSTDDLPREPSSLAAASAAAPRHFLRALQQPSLRFYFAFLATGYTLAALYGSFVPFRFVWPDDVLAAARDSLAAVRGRGAVSLFDGLANVALFTPLGFLWSAAALYSSAPRQRLLRSAGIIGLAALLSAAVECVQLGLPERTVSPLDVIAEALGAALGCAAWWVFGQRWTIWLAGWQAPDSRSRLWSWALQVYLACVTVWWLMPLDLTCRPGELAAKARERVLLKPFSEVTAARGFDAALAFALFLPVGVLIATAGRSRVQHARTEQACRWTLLALMATLTAGQLLVFSRTTDILQVAALGWGLAAGCWIAHLLTANESSFAAWLRRTKSPIQAGIARRAEPHAAGEASPALRRSFVAAVVAALALVSWSLWAAAPGELWFTGRIIPEWSPTWGYICYWYVAIGALSFAPRVPILGPLIFVLLGYGVFHRGDLGAEYLRAIGGLEIVASLGLAAAVLGVPAAQRRLSLHMGVGLIATAYVLWAMVSAGNLLFDGRAWRDSVTIQCVRLLDCAAVYWMGSLLVPSRSRLLWLAWVLTVGIFLPGILSPEHAYMNHVTASLVAISIPLSLYALFQTPSLPFQLALGLILVKLGGMLYAGQSRSAISGAAAGVLAYAALSRYRWWWLAALTPASLIAWQASQGSFVSERFGALLQRQQGWDTGRLEIWERAMNDFRASPWFGMGPGTGPEDLNDVHSSYLAALSETGAVGLSLYVLFWLSTIAVLLWLIFAGKERWKSDAAKPLLAAIIAHLVIGVGYSLHALQLAFLLAGLGIALSASSPRLTAREV